MKKFDFLARPEPLVNDILSLKTSGSGDENASGGTVLLAFTLRMRSFYRTEFLTICVGENIRVGLCK